MGANDKLDATFHGGEYTPRLSHVRAAYARTTRRAVGLEESEAQFARWLSKIRAEAKAEALEEAIDALMVGPEANLNPDGTMRPQHLHRSPRLNHKPRLRVANWLLRRANQYKEQS